MLTWAGFSGKLITFLITKIIGKKVDLSFDQRKRAAKAFVKLFYAITNIEALTKEFAERVQPLVNNKKSRVYSHWMSNIANNIDKNSIAFFQALSDVQLVINIYDPQLSGMLAGIRKSKAEILSGISLSAFSKEMRFKVEWDEDMLKSIEYTLPSDELMSVNFEDVYQSIEKIRNIENSGGIHEWPEDALLSLIEDRFTEGSVTPEDIEEIKKIHQAVEKYLPLLTNARERLGQFIKEQFTIDDLLYLN